MLVADPVIVTSEMVEDVLKMKRLDGVEAALRKIASACFAGGRQALALTPRLGELRVPVQVIWGAEDRIVPPRHAEGLPPAVKVTRLAGAGHLAHMEQAGEVNALIEAMVGG
jgi:pyruvate dehydrogenase E2 component (dihydrolipoamide acetyltransferase)